MKRILILLLTVAPATLVAQQKSPIILEVKGELTEILPGSAFAYGILHLKDEADTSYYRFPPEYGQLIVDNLKPGSRVELKVKIRPMPAETRKRLFSVTRSFMNEIIAIRIKDGWISMQESRGLFDLSDVYVEKKVIDDFSINGYRVALLFNDGLVAYVLMPSKKNNPFEHVKQGDYVSFAGFEFPRRDGYVYPVGSVKSVIMFSELKKSSGQVKSFLYKQNFVCLGMVVNTSEGELRFGFPSNRASAIMDFVKKHEEVTIYYSPFKLDRLKNSTVLRALVSGRDTFRIRGPSYFGGEDVRHDHIESSAEGKISGINRSDKGEILSIILENDYYIEIDRDIEKQLGAYLKRGKKLKVEGMQRIKIAGEIYSREYKIITPKKIVLEEKIFLINPQP